MGFSYAGSISGAAPIIEKIMIGETCYVGQILMQSGMTAELTVQDVANEAHENDLWVYGLVTGVYDTTPSFSGTTGYGDTATYITSQADQTAHDPVGPQYVEIIKIIPWDTLITGSIYDGTYGKALTAVTVTTGDAEGDDVVHASDTLTAPNDGQSVAYCRTGANRGQHRLITSGGANDQDLTICFTYDIAVGDTFVCANVRHGLAGLYIGSTANFIDGTTTMSSAYYDCWVKQFDLSESGKETVTFCFLPSACGPAGA